MTEAPTPVDPEVAAATFEEHLLDFFKHSRPARDEGWGHFRIDDLTAIVILPARRAGGAIDPYFVRLGAACYDVWPSSTAFVEPTADSTWTEAGASSRWWPRISGTPFSFGLHNPYRYPDGHEGQLLCFSHTLEYYLSNHNPSPEERWVQGRHTLTATLTRLADVMSPPYYQGRSGG